MALKIGRPSASPAPNPQVASPIGRLMGRRRGGGRTQPDPALTSTYSLALARGFVCQELTGPAGSAFYSLTRQFTRTYTTNVCPLRMKAVISLRTITNNSPYGELTPADGDYTVRATWERLSTGATVDCTFAGDPVGHISSANDFIIETDPVEGTVWSGSSNGKWPASTAWALRLEIGYPVGGQRPVGWRGIQTITNTLGIVGTITEQCITWTNGGQADQVRSAGAINATGGSDQSASGVCTAAFIGEWIPGEGPRAVMWMSHSILDRHAGLSEQQYFAAGNLGNFIQQALKTRTSPYVQYAMASAQLLRGYGADSKLLKHLMRYTTHFVIDDGTNEIPNGFTAAQLYTIEKQVIQDALLRGTKRIVAFSVLPRTSSASGNWTSAADQTPVSSFGAGGVRDQLNALRLGGVGSVEGYDQFVDTSAPVQNATDANKWITTGASDYATADGIHPSNAAHALIAAPLATTMFTWTIAGGI